MLSQRQKEQGTIPLPRWNSMKGINMVEEEKSFGDFLVNLGILSADHLKRVSQEQKQRGEPLEQTVVRLGYAKEELISQCMADYFNLPYVDLDTYLIDEKVLKTIP